MDPPLPPIPFAAVSAVQQVDYSPRAADGDGPDALPQVPGAKLRLMCSYGGHIMPRPHDKALAYVGGETRLIVVDRHASLDSLCSRISRTLLNGRSFTLKYQLPKEDLDSLVSVTADEDLNNMIEEYDRVTSSSALPSSSSAHRIRLFLFVDKLETAATMGSLLADAKSETWFVDALNGSGLLPRGLSDSAAVDNCLVNLDDVDIRENLEKNVNGENSNTNSKQVGPNANAVVQQQEMQLNTMPDSPMLETASSSYGSSSSSPSMANLPSFRVRVNEEQRMEEQFAQMSFSSVQVQRQIEDGIGSVAAHPPAIPSAAMADAVTTATFNNGVEDDGRYIGGQVYQDNERSDPCMPAGYRKPPLPLQPVTVQPRAGGGYSLPSPESVASDNSISSATSYSKPMYSQEVQDQAQATSRGPGTQADTTPVQATQISVQPVPHPGYLPDQHQNQQQQPVQQQYTNHQQYHPGFHYVPHPSSYYPVYTHQADPHQQQNYPVYVMPMAQSQQYVSLQSGNHADPSAAVPPNGPLTHPNPAGTPQLYQTSKQGTTNPKQETVSSMYRTAVAPQNAQVIQVQPPPQYMGYTQTQPQLPHHVPNAGYGYDYTNLPPNEPAFYHHAQYQSMTPAAAAAALVDASNQMMPMDGNLQQTFAASQQQ